jgi:hypothetical protein
MHVSGATAQPLAALCRGGRRDSGSRRAGGGCVFPSTRARSAGCSQVCTHALSAYTLSEPARGSPSTGPSAVSAESFHAFVLFVLRAAAVLMGSAALPVPQHFGQPPLLLECEHAVRCAVRASRAISWSTFALLTLPQVRVVRLCCVEEAEVGSGALSVPPT